jgi:hypothetical protein
MQGPATPVSCTVAQRRQALRLTSSNDAPSRGCNAEPPPVGPPVRDDAAGTASVQNKTFTEPENRRGMEYCPCTMVLSFDSKYTSFERFSTLN